MWLLKMDNLKQGPSYKTVYDLSNCDYTYLQLTRMKPVLLAT